MTTSTIDNFQITKTLGEGFSAKVKLAKGEDGNQYALKIFNLANKHNNDRAMKYLKNEVEMTLNLNHKHIVKYHKFEEKTDWVRSDGKGMPVAYIAQEPILGGELFDYVANSGSLSEPICRYYFKQML